MIRIDREEFLHNLHMVEPGLASRHATVEQSDALVFMDGQVVTYNIDVCCRMPSGLSGKIKGAIKARPLLAILDELPDDVIGISFEEGRIVIRGKNKRTRFNLEKKIGLPVEDVEQAEEWKELPADFSNALSLVQECAGKNHNQWKLTCVHIHPNWIEATDNFRFMRYKIKTGVDRATMVRQDNIKHIVPLGMTEFAETDNWIHFRSSTGLSFSCRRYVDEYHDLSKFFDIEGDQVTLPKGLADSAKRAAILSSEDKDTNIIKVSLRSGEIRLMGVGLSGDHEERKKVVYKGRPLSFTIFPRLLAELVSRHTECVASQTKLMIDGGKWRYGCILNKGDD